MKRKVLLASLILTFALSTSFVACKAGTSSSTTTHISTTQIVSTSQPASTSKTTSTANWWDSLGTPTYGGTLTMATSGISTFRSIPSSPWEPSSNIGLRHFLLLIGL